MGVWLKLFFLLGSTLPVESKSEIASVDPLRQA